MIPLGDRTCTYPCNDCGGYPPDGNAGICAGVEGHAGDDHRCEACRPTVAAPGELWADACVDRWMKVWDGTDEGADPPSVSVRVAIEGAIREAIAKAVEVIESAAALEEAAKGLVENPEWDYDGATEVEKNYYRRFAAKCLARVAPAIRALGAGA